MKYELAICAIFKNEALYIKEWIDYHHLMGVQKFFLFNHESTDNFLSVLAPYMYKGLVECVDVYGECPQVPAYNACLEQHRMDVKWLAFIDVDEFIVPTKDKNILDFLANFEDFPGVGINWVMFDSNGHITRPKGSVLENYTRCHGNYNDDTNHIIKSIVQPCKVVKMIIHHAIYANNKYAVTEQKKEILGTWTKRLGEFEFTEKVSIEKIRINHYFSKSYEDLVVKIARGRADVKQKRKLTSDLYIFYDYIHDFPVFKHLIRLYPTHIVKNILRYIYCRLENPIHELIIFTRNLRHKMYLFLNKYSLISKKKFNLEEKSYDKWRDSHVYRLLSCSPYFEKKWYLGKHPDVRKENLNPLFHYLNEGWKLGYNPSLSFDGNKYLDCYVDVKNAKINPLFHYERYERKEGRKVFHVTKD